MDAVYENFKDLEDDNDDESGIKVAVVGRPNAGKSSLVNYILGEDRLLVSDIPERRDSVDACDHFGRFVFIDTAGIRKKNKIYDNIERYSVIRSYMSIDRADVVLIMIDASLGVTEQDTKIAGYAHEQGKASVIVINKWDSVEKDNRTMKEAEKKVREALKYMSYAPMLFISAKTGQRVEKLYPLIVSVAESSIPEEYRRES